MALRVHNSDISVPGRRYKQIQDLPILRRDLLRTASVPHRAVAVLTMPQSGETVSPQMTLIGMALPPRYREITIRVFFTFFRFPKIFFADLRYRTPQDTHNGAQVSWGQTDPQPGFGS